jgi:hypothetical protein
MSTVAVSGALFGRTDVAHLLNIPEWRLANFADPRYRYDLAPSVRGGKGRGKKGLYTLADVYKIATAYRMLAADQDTRVAHGRRGVVAEAVGELFPKNKDPMVSAVKERAVDEADARCVVIDFAMVTFFAPAPEASKLAVPNEWQSKNPTKRHWVALRSRGAIAEEIRFGTLRTFFVMPFDELLNWVDSQILGREVTFARPTPTTKKNKKG